MATIIVGEEKFGVHKTLLAFYSEFFDAALFGNFLEAEKGQVSLHDVNADAFKAYMGWIYTGHVESPLLVAELWVLGDQLRSSAFTNEIMYLLFALHSSTYVTAQEFDYVEKNTLKTSKLREYINKQYNWREFLEMLNHLIICFTQCH